MPFFDDVWQRAGAPLAIGGTRAFHPTDSSALLLWISPEGSRHCLIPCGTTFPKRNERVAKALSVSTRELELEGRGKSWHIDIQCLDSTAHRLFDYLIHDLDTCNDVLAVIDVKIEEYRRFWGQAPIKFTYKDAVGLFGEVLFMQNWLSIDPAHGFHAWTGAANLLHDFSWSAGTVEVKTTLAGLPATHSIGTLEQLSWQDGRPLLLFSLAVRQDLGAGTFLVDLIARYQATLVPFGLDSKFNRLILERGYRPDDPNNDSYRYIVLNGGGCLYEVRDDFPRLTSESFVGGKPPSSVGGISYEIFLAGCEEYLSDHRPGFDARAAFGDSAGPDKIGS